VANLDSAWERRLPASSSWIIESSFTVHVLGIQKANVNFFGSSGRVPVVSIRAELQADLKWCAHELEAVSLLFFRSKKSAAAGINLLKIL